MDSPLHHDTGEMDDLFVRHTHLSAVIGMVVQALTAKYRQIYNRTRPHCSLGYSPPALAAILPAEPVPMLAGLA